MKTLILIGNGYDVAMSYKTRYSDFIGSTYFPNKIKNSLCEYISDASKRHEKWIDLEMELYDYSLELTSRYGDHGREAEIEARKFKTEYEELRKALNSYINYANSSISVDSDGSRNINSLDSLFFDWIETSQNRTVDVISFNYTRTLENKRFQNYIQRLQIHGCINFQPKEDNIVLGIDESMKVSSLHSFLNKSLSDNIKNIDFPKLVLNAERYIVFGSSLGKTDDWYYKKIFNRDQKGKVFEIYYYGVEEKDSIKSRIFELTGSNNDFNQTNKLQLYDSSDLQEAIESERRFYNSLQRNKTAD